MTNTCQHKRFTLAGNVQIFENIGRFAVDVRVNCADCNVPMRFLGVARGCDLTAPIVSADQCEARLPIHPVDEDLPAIEGGEPEALRVIPRNQFGYVISREGGTAFVFADAGTIRWTASQPAAIRFFSKSDAEQMMNCLVGFNDLVVIEVQP